MARLGMAVIAVCALAAAGCGGNTIAAPKTSTVAAKTSSELGDRIEFTRASDGQQIGAIKFLEVVVLPDDCLFTPLPAGGRALGVRAEVDNAGEVFLPKPDVYGLAVIDRGGFTQKVEDISVRTACATRFPEIAPSQPSGKTAGWALIAVRDGDPAALTYTPFVAEPDSTITNIKPVPVQPNSAKIGLPTPLLGTGPASATATASAAPSSAVPQPAAPTAGTLCNPGTDRWATDADGGQLRCAFAGGPAAQWVESAPFVGTRLPGSPCELGAAVAESPTGVVLVCVGQSGSSSWLAGP